MEDNKKNFENHEFIKDFLATYTANGGSKTEAEMLKRVIGNNGYTLGQTDVLTGDIKIKENEIDGNKQTYLILTTEGGQELSLMSLMGVSSLKGYNLTDEVEVEYTGANNKKETRTTKSDLIEDFDFSAVWQPRSRNLLELAAMIADKEVDLTGKTVTFLGTAVKGFTAKKEGAMNGEKFKVGYKRAIETKLWSITD